MKVIFADENYYKDVPEAQISKYDQSHGSPFDCGFADFYYYREHDPHYWVGGKPRGNKITELTSDQTEAYTAGYKYAEWLGHRKDWT